MLKKDENMPEDTDSYIDHILMDETGLSAEKSRGAASTVDCKTAGDI